jgi:hypothetical protein
MSYLLSIPAVNTITGGKIYYRRAPTTAKMPWVIVTNSGGMRARSTLGGKNDLGKTLVTDTLTLYVDSVDQFKGKDITDRIIKALENYRGDMGAEKDLFIRSGTPRDLDGYNGTFRQLITLYIEYWMDSNIPS